MNLKPTTLASVFGVAGVLHFIKPEPFNSIVPPGLPGSARFYTLASGAAELTTAALLLNPSTRALGGAATTALSLAVWPGNFEMARQWQSKPWYMQAIAYGRLPLQIPLITSGLAIARGN